MAESGSLLPMLAAGTAALILLLALGEAGVALIGSLRRSFQRRDAWANQLEQLEERLMTARIRRVDRGRESASWNGYRKFRIDRKVKESSDVCSFYLQPHDGKPIPSFRPGQYLTFGLKPPGEKKAVVRCYSLSDAPDPSAYRISIKRIGPPRDQPEAPPGRGSCFFHDHLQEGDIVDIKAPGGDFFLDLSHRRPIVLIGGGVGITPVLSMLNATAQRGLDREVWFFYGVTRPEELIMRDHLRMLAQKHSEHLHMNICLSGVEEAELPSEAAVVHHAERASVDLFERVLPSNNFEYYICGPAPMMESITTGLREWGVPDASVHFESFGASTVRKTLRASEVQAGASSVKVRFAKSDVELVWDPSAGSLLDLAEANGLAIDSGCRAGSCGTCATAIKSGEIRYLSPPGEEPDPGTCLACIAIPSGEIELDA